MKSFLSLFLLVTLFHLSCSYELEVFYNFGGIIPPVRPCDCEVICGDGFCAPGETERNCPFDCGNTGECGDGTCNTDETVHTCPADCSRCSDGICSGSETLATCPEDCKVCGDGQCSIGETLSNCPSDCSNICGNGACESGETTTNCPTDCQCQPVCPGNCGDNGCGGSCGTCPTGQSCVNFNCQAVCTPSCVGKTCGDNGCGGSCGTCPTGQSCVNSVCQSVCTPSCVGKTCGDNGCGGSCGTCPTGQSCVNFVCQAVCTPSCVGKTCGDNGCGGSCGTCPTGQSCVNFNCQAVCTPSCVGKTCGDNGCGGSCGTCPTGQSCVNFNCQAVCTPSCVGKVCGDNGCGGSCGTCTTGTCVNGVCSDSRTVSFHVIQVSSGSAGNAPNVVISTGSSQVTTDSSGSASILVALGGTVTFSGSGYQTVSLVISGSSSSMRILIPPTLASGEVFAAAIWADTYYDLDFNMFGPGNRTHYPTEEGVVNWTWEDKSEQSPYSRWSDRSGIVGAEVIDVSQMDNTAVYDFMLFHWSRVGQNDDTGDFNNAEAQIFIFGGDSTGVGSWTFTANPPTPPTGFVYGYFSPFTLSPTGSGHQLVTKTNVYDPAISQQSIDAQTALQYPCSYPTYCPYNVPL